MNGGLVIPGAGFASKSKYLFGKVTTQIKLVEGDSAGTVTAYYVSILYYTIYLPKKKVFVFSFF